MNDFLESLGFAIVIFAIFLGFGGCVRLVSQTEIPVIVIKDSFNK